VFTIRKYSMQNNAIPQNSLLTNEGSHGYCLYPTKERGAHENPQDIIPYDPDDLSV